MQHHGLRTEQKTEQVLALQSLTVISIVSRNTDTTIMEERIEDAPYAGMANTPKENKTNVSSVLLASYLQVHDMKEVQGQKQMIVLGNVLVDIRKLR